MTSLVSLIYLQVILYRHQSNTLLQPIHGLRMRYEHDTVSCLSKHFSVLSSYPSVVAIFSAAKYRMTSAYNLIEYYMQNKSKILSTLLHNQLVPYFYHAIIMVSIFRLCSSYNSKDELANLMFDSTRPTQSSMALRWLVSQKWLIFLIIIRI